MTMYTKVSIVAVIIISAVGVWFGVAWWNKSQAIPPPPPRDLTGVVVPPVTFPLRGYQFTVPSDGQVVTLDLVLPTARRDYPMARFVHASSSSPGTLTAFDDFATEPVGDIRAVPIAVTEGTDTNAFYVARLQRDGDSWRHLDSTYFGEFIRLQSVTINEQNQVLLSYLVHDRSQVFTEVPQVQTTAIISLADATVVQAGRNPKTETVLAFKTFTGTYTWQQTEQADGTVVTPTAADAFTLRFNANRIELTTDCNSGSTPFTTEPLPATSFSVNTIASTKMFCDSAQEAPFFAMVSDIVTYAELDDTTLQFTLSDDSIMTFVRQERVLQFESES